MELHPFIKCLPDIAKCLDLTEVIPYLMSKGYLNEINVSKYEPFSKLDYDRNVNFILKICRKGLSQEILFDALKYSGQEHIIDIIKLERANTSMAEIQNDSGISSETQSHMEPARNSVGSFSTINGETEKQYQEICDIFCERYIKACMNPKSFVPPTIKSIDNTGQRTSFLFKNGLDFISIMSENENERLPSLVFLKGKPGCGATTLIKIIAHDWASQIKRGLKQFYDLIVVIELQSLSKTVKYESIEELIDRVIGTRNFFSAYRCLSEQSQAVKKKILVILDGYEYESPSALSFKRDGEKKLLYGEEIFRMPFDLMISKSGVRLREPSHMRKDRNSMIFKVSGFTEVKQTDQFIFLNVFDELCKSTLQQDLANNKYLQNLAKNPYLLFIICLVYEKLRSEKKPELYAQLIMKILEYYDNSKNAQNPDCATNLNFCSNGDCRICKTDDIHSRFHNFEALKWLCQDSFHKLIGAVKKQTNDQSNEYNALLRKIGLLMGTSFIPPHTSFRYYFAAFYYCCLQPVEDIVREKPRDIRDPEALFDKFVLDFAIRTISIDMDRIRTDPCYNLLLWDSMYERTREFFEGKKIVRLNISSCEVVQKLMYCCPNIEIVQLIGTSKGKKNVISQLDFGRNKHLIYIKFFDLQFQQEHKSAFLFNSQVNETTGGYFKKLTIKLDRCKFLTQSCLKNTADAIQTSKIHSLIIKDMDFSQLLPESDTFPTHCSYSKTWTNPSPQKLHVTWNSETPMTDQRVCDLIQYFPCISKLRIECKQKITINLGPLRRSSFPLLSEISLQQCSFNLDSFQKFVESIQSNSPKNAFIVRFELLQCIISDRRNNYADVCNIIQRHSRNIEQICIDGKLFSLLKVQPHKRSLSC